MPRKTVILPHTVEKVGEKLIAAFKDTKCRKTLVLIVHSYVLRQPFHAVQNEAAGQQNSFQVLGVVSRNAE